MATFIPIQNQSFVQVQNNGLATPPAFNSPILLTCKDNQGNTIQKNIVEVSSTDGFPVLEIMLPSIESLGNDLNCEIQIVIKTIGSQKINVYCFTDGINPPTDTIGQASAIGFSSNNGAVLTFTPAYEGYWALNETIN